MRRSHRKAHFLLWVVIGPLAAVGLYLGVTARKAMPTQASPVADGQQPSNSPAAATPPSTEATNK